MRLLLLVSTSCCALALSGCVTKAKTYSAPDFKKLDAASQHLAAAHGKLAATTARAETKLSAAQKNADAIAEHSANIINLVDELAKLAPPELQPRFADLKSTMQAEQSETGDLVTNLLGAQSEISQLKSNDIPEAMAAKVESDSAIAAVKVKSIKTAADATRESADRYKAQSQLVQQKIFKWVWRGVGVLVALGIIVLIILLIAGKISIAGIRAYLHI